MRKPSKATISETMRWLSSLGASKGGKTRARNLSPERRSEIAKMGVAQREANRRARILKES